MPCFRPIHGYRSRELTEKGKRSIVFNSKNGFLDLPVTVPCGQCIGCRLERSKQWATRCMHEADMYDKNCFITLTYSPENLPKNGTLVVEDFQKFMKKLRKEFKGDKPIWNQKKNIFEYPIRFFHCGEYGEENKRPHYHALLFNFDFEDKEVCARNNDNIYYSSATLDRLWSKGICMVGDLTFESAAYVARYCTKKVTGEKAENHYMVLDYDSGEILGDRKPEYVTMSRNGGIGLNWYKQFKNDLYPDDFVLVRGKKCKVPKFYDKKLEEDDKKLYNKIKAQREANAVLHEENNTRERLEVREIIQNIRAKMLKRSFENES